MATRPRGERHLIKSLFIEGETPTGSATTWTLAHTPRTGSVEMFANGVRLTEDATSGGFSIIDSTITTTESYDPAGEGDELRCNYQRVEGT